MLPSKNPFINPSFKYYFIEKWNVISKKNHRREVPLGEIIAESLAIMLDLMNDDQATTEQVTEAVNAEVNAPTKSSLIIA